MADIGYIKNSFNGFDFFKLGINCEEVGEGVKLTIETDVLIAELDAVSPASTFLLYGCIISAAHAAYPAMST